MPAEKKCKAVNFFTRSMFAIKAACCCWIMYPCFGCVRKQQINQKRVDDIILMTSAYILTEGNVDEGHLQSEVAHTINVNCLAISQPRTCIKVKEQYHEEQQVVVQYKLLRMTIFCICKQEDIGQRLHYNWWRKLAAATRRVVSRKTVYKQATCI